MQSYCTIFVLQYLFYTNKMPSFAIRNAVVVNDHQQFEANILVKNGLIYNLDSLSKLRIADVTIDAKGRLLTPGCIDDQVHFREPGLTTKGSIASESLAAAAGGVTSYMEMPNTVPAATTIELLEQKYAIAAQNSWVNYSFFLGASNQNLAEIMRADYAKICGIKIFMGSSTGNLRVNDETALEEIFRNAPALIATHCEDDDLIAQNLLKTQAIYGNNLQPEHHPKVRDAEACFASSQKAVLLAKKHGSRLHILHISTEKELALFDDAPLTAHKKITAEVCLHHLWFSEEDYAERGNFIKWNPAIKSHTDRDALRKAILTHKIDVIASDHAPHTLAEKSVDYLQAPSGAPLVQHTWVAMLELYKQGVLPSIATIVEKMCHNPARLFGIKNRGFIEEGYFADLVITDLNAPFVVSKQNILYQCGWSPLEGVRMSAQVAYCFVNGALVWANGKKGAPQSGARLVFER